MRTSLRPAPTITASVTSGASAASACRRSAPADTPGTGCQLEIVACPPLEAQPRLCIVGIDEAQKIPGNQESVRIEDRGVAAGSRQ